MKKTVSGFFHTMTTRSKPDARKWLAGQFEKNPHPMADKAVDAWTEFMGRESAELWMDARREHSQR